MARPRAPRIPRPRFSDEAWRRTDEPAPVPFRELVWSDYAAIYDLQDGGSARRLLAPIRFLLNPSLHATLLIRAANASPRWTFALWRNLLLTKHTIDLLPHCRFGRRLRLPHPWGLCIGAGVVIGDDCLINHNVSIGTARATRPGEYLGTPRIGDRVTVYLGTLIAGDVTVGSDSTLGAYCLVTADVPEGQVVSAKTTWPSKA